MSKSTLEKRIVDALQDVTDLNSSLSIVKTGTLYNIDIQKDLITIILNIRNNKPHEYEEIKKRCADKIIELDKTINVNIILTSENEKKMQNPVNSQSQIKPEGIKHIIVVASGKGGVGKSTITNNLAISLSKTNLKIGILDADIYGPSQPKMLGISNLKPSVNKDGKLCTVDKYGIKCMSIGLLIDETRPIIWRGPMVQGALEQLLKDINWGQLDILLVDMPPGTGDVQLTLSQRLKLSGAIIVSTPQDIALVDAKKGLNMFKKVEVPIIGIIENMSFYLCPHCNKKQEIFGNGGARLVSKELKVPFLGEIPLDIEIRKQSDIGEPISSLKDFKINEYFDKIAKHVTKFIEKNNFDEEPQIRME